MSVEKWWNEICGSGKRKKPLETTTQTSIRASCNLHGLIETQIRNLSAAVGDELITASVTDLPSAEVFYNFCSSGFNLQVRDHLWSSRSALVVLKK